MNQQTRLLLTMLGLFVLAGVVGLYAWKGIYEPDEKQAKQKDVTERLFSPQKVDEKNPDGATVTVEFVRLSITSGGDTTVLERAPDADWRITSPVQAPAEKFALDGLLSQLQTAKFKYVADEDPDAAALEKYGFNTPSFVVEADALVGDSKEKRSVRLVGGAENSFNGSIFVRRNHEKQVWAAEGGVKWTFGKSTFDLREKEVFAVDEPKVQSVTVKTKNNAYELTRTADKSWDVKTPKETFRADTPTITAAITGLRNDKATAFPKEAPSFDGADELTFKTDAGVVGVKIVKAGDKAFEQVGDVVAEVPPNALSHFDRNPNDLRDKTVAVFKQDQVAKVTFHVGEGPDIVVERDAASGGGTGETWKVTAPRQGPAKQFKIAALLWTLGSIKYAKVADAKAKPDFKRWAAVSDASGKELARLTVGADVPGTPSNKYMKGSSDKVVEADATRLADLPSKVEELLDLPADAGP